MSEDSPKIVDMETSPELSEFLSEFEFPSEAGAASASPAPAAPVAATAPAFASPPLEPATVLPSAALLGTAPVARPVSPAADEIDSESEQEPSNFFGPATVTDFPVRPQVAAAVVMSTLTGPSTLVDLIERRGGFEWREAVAVIRQICLHLKSYSPQAPILLDPRNIQISDHGEVRLLSGQSSSDPLVIQVGRLLRTMLMGKEAPPELRLLLAQATFELPIFESIEDVDRALGQLDKLDEPGPAGLALLRAIAAPPKPPDVEAEAGYRAPSVRSILPANAGAGRRTRPRARQMGALFGGYALQLAVIFAGIAVIGVLLLTRPAFLFEKAAPASSAPPAVVEVPGEVPTGTAAMPARSEPKAVDNNSAPAPKTARDRRPEQPPRRDGVVTVTPVESTVFSGGGDPTRPTALGTKPTATLGIVTPPGGSTTPVDRRNPAPGQFDSLVSSNPLFEPKPEDLTPEALAAFRATQLRLLPVTAQRNYYSARTAFEAGDGDTALALAREALAIIDRRLGGAPSPLRDQVQTLIQKAATAVKAQNDIVYTDADADVIPPEQLTRQLPATTPIGIPPNRVGWLEMIIGRDGSVENVRLHTVLNRHHERMIVSAAKAWRYRPATRFARPVRYRILVKVNLPESGTD